MNQWVYIDVKEKKRVTCPVVRLEWFGYKCGATLQAQSPRGHKCGPWNCTGLAAFSQRLLLSPQHCVSPDLMFSWHRIQPAQGPCAHVSARAVIAPLRKERDRRLWVVRRVLSFNPWRMGGIPGVRCAWASFPFWKLVILGDLGSSSLFQRQITSQDRVAPILCYMCWMFWIVFELCFLCKLLIWFKADWCLDALGCITCKLWSGK